MQSMHMNRVRNRRPGCIMNERVEAVEVAEAEGGVTEIASK